MQSIFITLCFLVFFYHSGAQWNNNPSINTPINTETNKPSFSSSITTDGNNGYYIAWSEMDMVSFERKIYVQRLNSLGVAMWPGKGVVACRGNFSMTWPKVKASSKGVFVVWQDSRYRPYSGLHAIYAQFITSAGAPAWELNGKAVYDKPATNSMSPQIVLSGDDAIIVAWWELPFSGSTISKILSQKIAESGNLMWPNDYTAICDVNRRIERFKMVSDGNGGAVFAWSDFRNAVNDTKSDVYAQKINSNGDVAWQANGEPVCLVAGNQDELDMSPDGAGGAVIAWRDYRRTVPNENSADLYSQRINSNGMNVWQENGVLISEEGTNASRPSLTFDGKNSTYFSWISAASFVFSIEGQLIDNNGTKRWQQPLRINDGTLGMNNIPFISNDGHGGAIVTWSRSRSSTHTEIVAQHVYANEKFEWDKNGLIVCNAPNTRTYYAESIPAGYGDTYSDGDGSKVLTWIDNRVNNQDIYATKIYTKPPVPEVINIVNHCNSTSNGIAKLLNPPINTTVKIFINDAPVSYNAFDSTFTYFSPSTTPYGKHTVTIQYENKSGEARKDTLFEHQELFTPELVITSNRTVLCKGETETFEATVKNINSSLVSFSWKINNTNAGIGTNTFKPSVLNDGDIISCETIINASVQCLTSYTATSNLITVSVKEYIKPTINIIMQNNNVCEGDTIHFIANSDIAIESLRYSWLKNGEVIGNNQKIFSSHTLQQNDKIECWVYPNNESCFNDVSKSNTLLVNVNKSPIVKVYPEDTLISYNSQVKLAFTSSEPITTYSWKPALKLVDHTALSPLTIPIQNNEKYDLQVISNSGCKANKTLQLNVLKKFLMPTAFTPNNDGKNDVFRIPENTLTSIISFKVFNRWGQEIFSTTDVNKGWNGYFNNKKSDSGVYVYIIKTNENNLGIIKGVFHLIN